LQKSTKTNNFSKIGIMKLMGEKQAETQTVDRTVKDFLDALLNLFIFLPYYFSVPTLFKTLTNPWKNLIAKKVVIGFSFSEWLSRLSFNLISRMIGFFMRVFLILTFFIIELIFILAIPTILIIFFVTLPVRMIISSLQKSEKEKKNISRDNFIQTHMLQKENLKQVDAWFEVFYKMSFKKSQWWTIDNLFSIPPLGRDWASGYTPTLDQYTDELTKEDYQRGIKKIVGREREIKLIEQILSKSEEANIILVGETGIGRQSIIDEFSRRIYVGKSNSLLNYKRVLKINLEAILTKVVDQKQRENFLEELLAEAGEAKNVILVIDNFERYISSGDVNHIDLSIPIEKFAKGNNLQIIGITTAFLYDKYVFPNSAISQITTRIDIEEVDKKECLEIILELAFNFEQRYSLTIAFETAQAIIEKSEFYMTNIPFPEKAIELLETTCSFAAQQHKKILLPEDVNNILTQLTHSPTRLDQKTKKTLVDFEKILSSRIISQSNAVNQLSAALRRSFLLLGKRKKPLASFLFLGPTGVGKTETAKVLAAIIFQEQKRLVRFDMALYQSKGDIPSLIGQAATQNPGLLTEAIRDNPYSVLLIDEIEKANRDLLNIFLTIFDEGYLTDGLGKKVDCKNLMIICTSNAGSDFIFEKVKSNTAITSDEMINYLVAKAFFSPEFLNRFDGVIVFEPLGETALYTIAQRISARINENYQNLHKIKIEVTDQFLKNLVQRGYSREFGARNLERTISQEIESKVAKMVLEGSVKPGQTIEFGKNP